MSKYCAYLTSYLGNKLPPFYIGSSSIEKIEAGYHGSVLSKQYKAIWEAELKENPHLFKTQIISYHNTRKEAIEKELLLQEKLDVIKNPLYVNQAKATVNGFFGRDVSGKNNPNYNNRWSKEQKLEASLQKKRFFQEHPESCEAISKQKLGKYKGKNNPNYQNYWSEEQKDKIRGENNPMFGKGFKGETNSMFGSHGQKHPRAKIYIIKNLITNITYEVYDRKQFQSIFNINVYDVMKAANKRFNKRRTWKFIKILPKDITKTEIYSIIP